MLDFKLFNTLHYNFNGEKILKANPRLNFFFKFDYIAQIG